MCYFRSCIIKLGYEKKFKRCCFLRVLIISSNWILVNIAFLHFGNFFMTFCSEFSRHLSCICPLESLFLSLQSPPESLEISQFTSVYVLSLYTMLVNFCRDARHPWFLAWFLKLVLKLYLQAHSCKNGQMKLTVWQMQRKQTFFCLGGMFVLSW